jgi:dipeptide/tripeptide permease
MADLRRLELSLQFLGHIPEPSWARALFASARLTLSQNLSSAHNSVAAASAVALVLVVGAVVATLWTSLGHSDISPAGWIATGFGIIFTLAVGIGLMALVFISSRRGYDELGRGSKAARPQNSGR